MNWNSRIAYVLVLPLTIAALGCESVALIGREDIDRRDVGRRDRDLRDRDLARDEIIGTIERVDRRDRELHLRTTDARTMTIQYSPRTVVISRDRELAVDELRRGDLVLVEVRRDRDGDRYADIIRLNDRRQEFGSWGR
ncbi:MAG: hypothetical protein R3268_10425 [Acidiferrobacterales bacterium]|nr:hypothetical protein [Acidiferrobacterales bacterium]